MPFALHMKNKHIVFSPFFYSRFFSLQKISLLLLAMIFSSPESYAQKKIKKIEVLEADQLIRDQNNPRYKDAHRLIGNVKCRHDNVLMFCDSASFFDKKNYLVAHGHIHVQQGDSLNLYGDSLTYDGNKKLGKLRGHIRVVEKDMRLVTDSINYDANKSIAYYRGGGEITSLKNNNVLTSRTGYYHSRSKEMFFRGDVKLKHPEYDITCDTLKYSTLKETATFLGPTVIKTKDQTIYCENGFYDTRKEKTRFIKNARIVTKEQEIFGDTIVYDRKTGKGEIFSNAKIIDTAQDLTLTGGYGNYDEINKTVLLTKNPIMIRAFEKDSLFLTGDTLYNTTDTNDRKSVFVYHHVKFYKPDFQGICDSMTYSDNDSTLRMYYNPVLWQEKNQLSADYVEVKLSGRQVKAAYLKNNSFIISQADTVGFNQIKGRDVTAFFASDSANTLKKVKVMGNGQTIYYVGEEGKPYTGMNKTDCSDIVIYLKEKEIDKITFITQPDAVVYPMDKINPKDKFLKDFKWEKEKRPKDFFNKKETVSN